MLVSDLIEILKTKDQGALVLVETAEAHSVIEALDIREDITPDQVTRFEPEAPAQALIIKAYEDGGTNA
jgi:hypothetical protein